ncbi:MepB family protein [Flavobacterium sp.]
MENHHTIHHIIKHIDDLILKPSAIKITNCQPERESQDYCAHTFNANNYQVKFRLAKITPTKTGQFVTLWKRNPSGTTTPHALSDPIDFYIIATRKDTKFGLFIFPQFILHQQGILSEASNDGKRGFRVYPTWDETTSKQARKTQLWQTRYFINLSQELPIDLQRVKSLFNLE